MSKTFKGYMYNKLGVLIGRFQGFTKAHFELLYKAAMSNDKVIVVIGSTNVRCSINNPWTVEQRIEMIKAVIASSAIQDHDIQFVSVGNHPNNRVWKNDVYNSVMTIDNKFADVTLYGCEKDLSSFYLNMFSNWKTDFSNKLEGFDATELRNLWYKGKQTNSFLWDYPKVSMSVKDWLYKQKFNVNLQGDWDYYQEEKKKFVDYPYPETLNFNCSDCVITCHGHVLMIKRGNFPGKDSWALIGGFKNYNETYFEAALRERTEEATFNLTEEQLKSCLVSSELFDDPKRSYGIPRITKAFLFDISKFFPRGELPVVVAGDDAADSRWTPIDNILTLNDIYDDHSKIIYKLVKG